MVARAAEASRESGQDLRQWLRLAWVAHAGTRRWLDAAAALGSPAAVFDSDTATLERLGLTPAAIARVRDAPTDAALDAMLARCARDAISILPLYASSYPRLLARIDDPPIVLFHRGELGPDDAGPSVAIVGARKASRYGLRVARALGKALAGEGVAVVSGLAYGIDAAAHAGALQAGTTIAVLAGGLDAPSPRRNAGLFAEVLGRGCAVSEHPPGTPHRAHHFPIRNRVITGMCVGTIVVEAAERSGTLISARLAAEQGRDVFAVPGNIDAPTAAGTNRLISDGAQPVTGAESLLSAVRRAAEQLGFGLACPRAGGAAAEPAAPSERDRAAWPEGAKAVLDALDDDPQGIDSVSESVALDAARTLELLTFLELEGAVERIGQGTFVRVRDLTAR